jgi:hypothetical protein
VTDRDADCWEALLAIVDIAGGDWPERARAAAVPLVKLGKEVESSLNLRLLADLRTIFGEANAMFTKVILERLRAMDEAPWSDLKGKEIDANRLAQTLKEYGVHSRAVRVGDDVAKGYTRDDLWDVWRRYLPPVDAPSPSAGALLSPSKGVTGVTPVTPFDFQGKSSGDQPLHAGLQGLQGNSGVTPVTPCAAACNGQDTAENGRKSDVVTGVTPVTPPAGDGRGNGEDRTCAQCHIHDGTEQQCSIGGSGTIWLHHRCLDAFLGR